jgi:flagellar biosynthesis component FlhA
MMRSFRVVPLGTYALGPPAAMAIVRAAGYSVVDAVTVITTHLGELIRQHAWELLGRAETKRLLDALNDSHPKLLEELVPKLLTLGEVGRVLEHLLRERVSIRDLGAILEALLETAPATPALRRLTDSVRLLIGSASSAALPVLLCPSPARYHVKRWLEPVLPRVAVVAASEIPPEIRMRPVGTVR